MDERPLGVHQIKFVVDAAEGFGNGGGVGHHADCSLHSRQISPWHHCRGLVVDAALETGRTPVDELDSAFGLDCGDSCVDVLRDDISTIHEAARHVLAVAGVALGHHAGWFKHRIGNLGD